MNDLSVLLRHVQYMYMYGISDKQDSRLQSVSEVFADFELGNLAFCVGAESKEESPKEIK